MQKSILVDTDLLGNEYPRTSIKFNLDVKTTYCIFCSYKTSKLKEVHFLAFKHEKLLNCMCQL